MRVHLIFLASILAAALPACNAKTEKPAERCALVPLILEAGMEGMGRGMAIGMDGAGRISTGLAPGQVIARFHPQGCVIGPDGVWAELTPSGGIWMQRQILPVAQGQLVLGQRRLGIQADGAVVGFDAQGQPEPQNGVIMRFLDYDPGRDRCAATLLLATYLGMMPSMAVVDGVAPTMKPPVDSICQPLLGVRSGD